MKHTTVALLLFACTTAGCKSTTQELASAVQAVKNKIESNLTADPKKSSGAPSNSAKTSTKPVEKANQPQKKSTPKPKANENNQLAEYEYALTGMIGDTKITKTMLTFENRLLSGEAGHLLLGIDQKSYRGKVRKQQKYAELLLQYKAMRERWELEKFKNEAHLFFESTPHEGKLDDPIIQNKVFARTIFQLVEELDISKNVFMENVCISLDLRNPESCAFFRKRIRFGNNGFHGSISRHFSKFELLDIYKKMLDVFTPIFENHANDPLFNKEWLIAGHVKIRDVNESKNVFVELPESLKFKPLFNKNMFPSKTIVNGDAAYTNIKLPDEVKALNAAEQKQRLYYSISLDFALNSGDEMRYKNLNLVQFSVTSKAFDVYSKPMKKGPVASLPIL